MRGGVLCGLVLVLVTGCAPTSDDGRDPGTPDTGFPPAQAWALGDDEVTEAEYLDAIGKFISCVRDAGYSTSDLVLSPIDGLTMLYDIPPSGDPDAWNKKVEECNLTHVSHIEPAYVETHDQVMEPALRTATAECLRGKGFNPGGNERNVKEFVEATDKTGNATTDCVTTTMRDVFPHVPGFLKIRW